MKSIQEIRSKIHSQDYELTGHAHEERMNDNFAVADIECAVMNGRIIEKLTGDPRGARFCVEGASIDGRRMVVVCRFLKSGRLRVITVYAK